YLKQFESGRKNRTKLGTLTKKVDSLSSEVESLSSEVESLTQRNAELHTEINRRFSTRLPGYVRRVARRLFQPRPGRSSDPTCTRRGYLRRVRHTGGPAQLEEGLS